MLKTLALLSALAAVVPAPAPSSELPELPPGVNLLTTHVAMVNGSPYVLAIFDNNTAVSFRVGGEGGVINLPDRALIALPGASQTQLLEMESLAFPTQEPNWGGGVIPPFVAQPALDPPQGITGGEHPVEITYSYPTAAGTGAATIVVTVRRPSRGDARALARMLRDHVRATQDLFPPQ